MTTLSVQLPAGGGLRYAVRSARWLGLTSVIVISLSASVIAQEVWVSDIHDREDRPKKGATEVRIVVPRNGAGSGKVVSARAGRATVSSLRKGAAVIPAQRVILSYAAPWDSGRGMPPGHDILRASPPDGGGRQPVWVTVEVPRDAEPGDYTGELTLEGAGKIPIRVEVADWALADTQDYRTLVDLVQSPETLALEYDVPLWSERHWAMIGRSLEWIGRTGSRSLYVPLIARTNLGNAETMIRWVKQGDHYEHDFSVFDRYIDLAIKRMGRPKLLILYAWEVYLRKDEGPPVVIQEGDSDYVKMEKEKAAARQALRDRGPAVTVVDGDRLETVYLPKYSDPAGRSLWAPVWTGIRERLSRKGLGDAALLGMFSDYQASKEDVQALHELSGGLSWASTSHHARWFESGPRAGDVQGITQIGYSGAALGFRYTINPVRPAERTYGWRLPILHGIYWRFGTWNTSALSWVRQEPEVNITGSLRGISHLGADFWPAVRDSRGRRSSTLSDRYPESYWHSLNIGSWLLGPDAEGPAPTVRFQIFREGIQECEARIFIEDALTDPVRRSRLGELAERAQQFLDDRQRSFWKARGGNDAEIMELGVIEYRPVYELMYSRGARWNAREGHQWFLDSDWQESSRRLFSLAGEVSRKLQARRDRAKGLKWSDAAG